MINKRTGKNSTHIRICNDVTFLLPSKISSIFKKYWFARRTGAIWPDYMLKDFQNHYFNWSNKRGSGIKKSLEQALAVKTLIKAGGKQRDIVFETAKLCHYFSDLYQPLHVFSGEDTQLHMQFEKDLNDKLEWVPFKINAALNNVSMTEEFFLEDIEKTSHRAQTIIDAYQYGNGLPVIFDMVKDQYNYMCNKLFFFLVDIFDV